MAVNPDALAAVRRLLSARYPTLEVDPGWLDRCIADVCQGDAAVRCGSNDQLARSVRQRLLETDLAQVVVASYSRIAPEKLQAANGKVGDSGRGAVLVQIESMIDIGCSAASQLEIAEARVEARRSNKDPNEAYAGLKPAASASSSSSGADAMAAFDAQEEGKSQGNTIYPRRMLKLELSDGGSSANVWAIELERIGGLDMNTTKMGSKLLLKGAQVNKGYLLLTPATVSVEGGGVSAKQAVAEEKLIATLRAQLGPPRRKRGMPSKPQAISNHAHDGNGSNHTTTAAQDRFSPDEDESMLLAALEAEAEAGVDEAAAAQLAEREASLPHETKPESGGPANGGAQRGGRQPAPIVMVDSDDDDDAYTSARWQETILIESSPEP